MAGNPLLRRTRRGAVPAAAFAFALLAAPACASPEPGVAADLYLQGPMVVAFVPASVPLADGTDPALARALAAQALSRVRACAGRPAVATQLVVADRIVVHDGPRVATFEIADVGPLAGALLLAPGANPSVVFAGGGPQALEAMLGRAAREYFRQACMR